jgi:hypothetical protein
VKTKKFKETCTRDFYTLYRLITNGVKIVINEDAMVAAMQILDDYMLMSQAGSMNYRSCYLAGAVSSGVNDIAEDSKRFGNIGGET